MESYNNQEAVKFYNEEAELLEELAEDRREIISSINTGYHPSVLQNQISVMKARLSRLKKLAEENDDTRKRLETNIIKYDGIINKIEELK